jgi:hypothetical protein
MGDIEILQEMILDAAKVPLESDRNGNIVILREPNLPDCSVTIHGMPNDNQVIVIKADAFVPPTRVFAGSKGECKRADFVIIANTEVKKVIICIEMKAAAGTSLESEIIQQLKGAQCFVGYCQQIGKVFWQEKTFLDNYVYRFVTIRNINLAKKPTRESKTNIHDRPERMLKINFSKHIQLDSLIGRI